MAKLRQSPFKVDRPEDNPEAFGLRGKQTIDAADALYNRMNVLLSGPRGIGKSSLGSQLQIILRGNNTLLKRCGIETKFSSTLCAYYACGADITLEQLVLDILYTLEKECHSLPNVELSDVKPSFEINLGIVTAKLETEVHSGHRSPATIATQFVAGLRILLQGIQKFRFSGINVLLDELEQLPEKIGFGKFFRIVHETLDRDGLSNITFILVGQHGIYTRFSGEHPSFERIVRHIPLTTLDTDAAEYILRYAAKHASTPFEIDKNARDLILGLASGYPYILHLLGNAAFLEMKNEKKLTQTDVLSGVEEILKSDKREKYWTFVRSFSADELVVLNILSRYDAESLPSKIPEPWIVKKITSFRNNDFNLVATLQSLVQKGYLIHDDRQGYYQFAEELFKVFLNLLNMERRELLSTRRSKEDKTRRIEQREEALAELIRTGDIGDIDDQEYLEVLDRDEEENIVRLLMVDSQDGQFSDGKYIKEVNPVVRNRLLREVRNTLMTKGYIGESFDELDSIEYAVYDKYDEGDDESGDKSGEKNEDDFI